MFIYSFSDIRCSHCSLVIGNNSFITGSYITAHTCSDRVDIGDSVRALSPALTDERGLLGGEESILIRRSKVEEKEEKAQSGARTCYINGTTSMVLGGVKNECVKAFLHVLRHFSLFSGQWSP